MKASIVANVRTVEPGEWNLRARRVRKSKRPRLLILEGFIARRVAVGDRGGVELLGQESLLQPWVDDGKLA